MIGIYKITNTNNGHCYIGQSNNIDKRWKNHKIAAFNINDKGYNYPLYRAIRKYGLDSFSFEILEECPQDLLNEREIVWIAQIKPEYNQTLGGQDMGIPSKLSINQVNEIKQILMNDPEGQASHINLAKKYNVHKDTIRDINVGRTWFDENLIYPLHHSKFDANKPNKIHCCCDCGVKIFRTSVRCVKCENIFRKKQSTIPITREELKTLIRTKPFTQIGKQFGVSDNAVRKWCDKYDLPRKSSEIKKISLSEWENI